MCALAAGVLRRAFGAGALLAVVVAVLVLSATPALAHGRGSDATNYASVVTAEPDVPGVDWRVYGGDEFLAVTNTSGSELLVPGYEGEPYVRIGPDGVFENRNSRAYYLNQDRLARVSVPQDLPPEPRWVRASGGDSHLWHDHRIHWMLATPPPVVQAAGGEEVLVQRWSVPFSVGGQDHVVEGELRWLPGPSPIPWLAAAALLTLPALAGLRTRAGEREWPGLARPAAVVLAAVALANLTHLVDDLFAVPLPVGTTALAALQTALFCGVGLFGAVRAWRGGDGAFTALGVGSGALLVGQGLLYLPVLTVSQTVSVLPDAVARLVVSLSVVQALPVGAVAVLGTRRLAPPPVERAPAEAPAAP